MLAPLFPLDIISLPGEGFQPRAKSPQNDLCPRPKEDKTPREEAADGRGGQSGDMAGILGLVRVSPAPQLYPFRACRRLWGWVDPLLFDSMTSESHLSS